MDTAPIPEYDEVPIEDIADGVVGLRILFVNVFAVKSVRGGWVLIDAGLPFSGDRITRWVESIFGKNTRPRSIIQTHGHFDHTGATKELGARWDVPIYAHRDEMPFLTGESEYPPPHQSIGAGVMQMYASGPVNVAGSVRKFAAHGLIQDLPDWEWVHTPGHTAGHVSLFRPYDGVLLAGDAFCTAEPRSFLSIQTPKSELIGPPAYYVPDWNEARASIVKLAELAPTILAPAHGLPMAGPDVGQALHRLASGFGRDAGPGEAVESR